MAGIEVGVIDLVHKFASPPEYVNLARSSHLAKARFNTRILWQKPGNLSRGGEGIVLVPKAFAAKHHDRWNQLLGRFPSYIEVAPSSQRLWKSSMRPAPGKTSFTGLTPTETMGDRGGASLQGAQPGCGRKCGPSPSPLRMVRQ